jgi:hypothetical protein
MFDSGKIRTSIDAGTLEAQVVNLRDEVKQLESRLERQTLLLQGFFTLMSERSEISEAQLLVRVTSSRPTSPLPARKTVPSATARWENENNVCTAEANFRWIRRSIYFEALYARQ